MTLVMGKSSDQRIDGPVAVAVVMEAGAGAEGVETRVMAVLGLVVLCTCSPIEDREDEP